MKLLSSPASPYTRKVRIVLAEKKIECDLEAVDVAPAENPVNAHNPLGKIPTLLLDDGSALYDSRVIVEFLDGKSPISRLIPEELRDRVAVRRWEALADGVLAFGAGGRVTRTVVPRPSSLSTVISPPRAVTRPWQMERPRPEPPPLDLVVTKGSKTWGRRSGGMPMPLSAISMRALPSAVV